MVYPGRITKGAGRYLAQLPVIAARVVRAFSFIFSVGVCVCVCLAGMR